MTPPPRKPRVHEAIEWWLNSVGWKQTRHYAVRGCYQEWEKEYGFKVLASEYKTYHRTRLYAGTADALFMDGDDLCLMDIKTSKTILEGLTAAQLYGYSEALKSHGVTVKRGYILHLMNDSTFEWIEVDKQGRMMFEACAYLHGV